MLALKLVARQYRCFFVMFMPYLLTDKTSFLLSVIISFFGRIRPG